MKKLSYFLSLACAALLASCSSDVEEFNVEDTNKAGKLTVTLGMPGADGTRFAFGNEITDLKWTTGEVIKIVGYQGESGKSGYHFSDGVYAANLSQDAKKASFTFAKWGDFDGYRMVYTAPSLIYDNDASGNDIVDCNYNAQNYGLVAGETDFGHIMDHLYMTTPVLKVLTDKSGIVEGGTFVPQCAILKLNIKSLPKELQNKDAYKVKFFVNYKPGVDPIATIKYGHAIEAGKFIYLAFDPKNELNAKDSIAFEISDKDANVTYTLAAKSETGKKYEKAKIYTVTLDAAKLGSWKGRIVKKDDTAQPIKFEHDFTTKGKGAFTIEGEEKVWSFGGAALVSAYSKGVTFDDVLGFVSYLVSPKIQLKTTNAVRFIHQMQNSGSPTDDGILCIRTVGGAWETLGTIQNQWQDETLTFDVPAKFDNQIVEFGFKYHAKTNNSSGDWFIKYFKVNLKADIDK